MPTATALPQSPDTPPPMLEGQTATAQGAADLAETALWRYRVRYLHDRTAYDEAIVVVSFNVAPPSDDTLAADLPPRTDYRYGLQLVPGDDGENIEALRLTREQDAPGPGGRWPRADGRAPDGDIVDLGTGSGDGATRTYTFDPPLPVSYWASIGLAWDGLNVAGTQNARVSLASVRRTGDDVHRSPTVDAASPAAPLNRWTQRLDITDLGDTVTTALDAALTALFGDDRSDQHATLGVYYGYRLGPADDAPMASLPVGLYPNLTLAATTAAQIGSEIAAWKAAIDPPAAGGEWTFSLALHSRFDASAPLLDLRSLVYRLG